MNNYKGSAIYSIVNLENNKIYVGSALNFYRRRREHLKKLRNNYHHSSYLQKSFNKYGKENFDIQIIEFVDDKNKLIEREQHWADFFNPEYNMTKVVASQLGMKRSEETKLKLSEKAKGNKRWLGKKHSEETKIKIGNSHRGKVITQAQRDKISKSSKGQIPWNKGLKASVKFKKLKTGHGRVWTEESKAKVKESILKYYAENPRKHIPCSESAKQKLRESQLSMKLLKANGGLNP